MPTAGADESTRPGEHENARFVPAWPGVNGSGDATSMMNVVLTKDQEETTVVFFNFGLELLKRSRVKSRKVRAITVKAQKQPHVPRACVSSCYDLNHVDSVWAWYKTHESTLINGTVCMI